MRANGECSWHNVSEKLKFAEERYITVKTKFLDPACSRNAYYDNIRIRIMDIPEVLQQNHYYPFGLNMTGIEEDDKQTLSSLEENMYQYNGKEKDLSLGLHWHDYGARQYDAQLGRWNGVDPLAEKYFSYSSYNYVVNNPIIFIDPDGRSLTLGGEDTDLTLEYLQSILSSKKLKNRISVDKETGKVSFNTEGLKENKKGGLRNKNADLINKLVTADESYFFAVSHNHNPHVEFNADGKIDGEHTQATTQLGTYNYGDGQVLEGDYVLESFTSVSVTPRGDEGQENPHVKGHIIPSTRPTKGSGHQGVLYISPGTAYTVNPETRELRDSKAGFVKHELKEIYLRTSESMNYKDADRAAGGVSAVHKYKLKK